jgi:predicted AAA+ superfamily ATPase
MNSIIVKDVIPLSKFKAQTITKISGLLYLLANSDKISYEKLMTSLKIERFETLEAMIDVLIASGILMKVKSHGKTYGSTRKTPKLLFIAPSLRTAILDNIYLTGIEGKKIEDYLALVYMSDLKDKIAVDLSYDIAEEGADFIVTLKDRTKIVAKVGFNKEDTSQVTNTQAKVNGKYGPVFGSKKLDLIDNFIVKIPLEYLLLI